MTQHRGFLSIPGATFAALLLWAGPVRAAGPSTGRPEAPAQARLIDAGRVGTALLAGLEVKLAPGFITYWRDPGDAGVPPTFAFAGSINLKSATPRYPAPRRLEEAGAVAFGYADAVVFPILVEAADPAKPVELAVGLDYAACHDICLPVHADLRATLDGRPSPDAGRVRAALAAVPRRAALGAGDGVPGLLGVIPDGAGGFTAEAEAALPATLFVEAPEGWAYEAGPAVPAAAAGRVVFPVKRLDAPKGADRPPAPLVLTLVAPVGAVEVPVQLDAASPKP